MGMNVGQVQPTLEQQAEMVEKQGLTTLLFCPNSWALRHRFINQETGEVRRARCDSWHCLYCGPRKVDGWRQIIKLTEPTLFVTFTQVGHTVEEASRVLTTVMQFLRRGSRGKGPRKVGARPAYPVEWFAVLERHSDFERVGFHWHVLVRGVEYIEHEHLREALSSATKGRSYIVHVERVQSGAVGYVTKYLTKDITVGEQGVKTRVKKKSVPVLEAVKSRQVVRLVAGSDGELQEVMEERPYLFISRMDEQGKPLREIEEELVERASKARRIRYSRHFFPLAVKDMRRRTFAGLPITDESEVVEGELVMDEAEQEQEQESSEEGELLAGPGQPGSQGFIGSAWLLDEAEEYSPEVEVYEWRRKRALLDALDEVRAGRRLSRRVVGIWAYQQGEQRNHGYWAKREVHDGKDKKDSSD